MVKESSKHLEVKKVKCQEVDLVTSAGKKLSKVFTACHQNSGVHFYRSAVEGYIRKNFDTDIGRDAYET
jgi:hypothetical protein